ncbi:hypothetical protein [Sporosarcina sp. P33]|uniref:hypothetical protein n=1 Tax=Sporosarcina sp. P33 TaxID=1930764 RepID=UPI0009BCEF3D|nr:hypothetical protein [Sporosarcina sp. P33]ARD46814.1 hypothetical protein SporoP33_00225 [Sporosarcina sp. P33]
MGEKRKSKKGNKCKCCCKCCRECHKPQPPEIDDDPVSLPITPEQVPTDTAGQLFSFVAVQAYYLPGAETTRNGNDRFGEDMTNVSQIWGFPIIAIPGGPVQLTDTDLGPDFSLPSNLGNLSSDNLSFRRLQQIHADRFPNTTKIIAVWYAPFSEQTSGIAGRAFSNIGLTNQNTASRLFNHIVICNFPNDSFNTSLLKHELGHIFFGTATIETPGSDRLIPVNNNCDPSSPNCSNNHSPQTGNLMEPTPGNKTSLTLEQRQKAGSTFLTL